MNKEEQKVVKIYFIIIFIQVIILGFVSFYIINKISDGVVVEEQSETTTCVCPFLEESGLEIDLSSGSEVEKMIVVEEVKKKEVKKGRIMEVSAYNLIESQCDNSPLIGAFGDNLMEMMDSGIQVCASNTFPRGTKLQIQGFGECVVMDRMAKKYKNHIDICMGTDVEQATDFGRQHLLVKVLKIR